MDPVYAVLALLGINVIVNFGVWFRLGSLGARLDTVEREVKELKDNGDKTKQGPAGGTPVAALRDYGAL